MNVPQKLKFLDLPISRLRNLLEGSMKTQIEGLDVNFHISNEFVHTLDIELRYVDMKLRKKSSLLNYSKMSLKSNILTSKCPSNSL